MKYSNPINIFISYAREDKEYKDAIIKHLSSIIREGKIYLRQDEDILPGEEWNNKIKKYLEDCDVILFLLSSDSLASKYIYETERRIAFDRFDNKDGIIIIPIIIRPCDWKYEYGKFQALPTDGKPLIEWKNMDNGCLSIVHGIKAIINVKKNNTTPDPTNPSTRNNDIQNLIQKFRDYKKENDDTYAIKDFIEVHYVSLEHMLIDKRYTHLWHDDLFLHKLQNAESEREIEKLIEKFFKIILNRVENDIAIT